jgi:MFS family permease
MVDSAVATALRRLLPILVLMHVIAYLDRLNITFAETTLSDDLALSATLFGLAAGIFFLPYVILEIPSNLALHRVGARLWMARIMVSWGIAAMLGALAWNAGSLIVARMLLGAAEAGFFPGVIYLLACWFPDAQRAKATGVFMLGIPIAVLVGGPLSGALLELDGVLGLDGWRWLFLLEGLPAVAVGLWLLRALPDRPTDARWLAPDEARALENAVAEEEKARPDGETLELRDALRDRRVLRLAAVYVCVNLSAYGVIFWLADLIERIGSLSSFEVGLISAIPFAFGTLGLLVLGRRSDHAGDRRKVLAFGMGLSAAGLVGVAAAGPVLGVAFLCVGTFGLLGAIPAFWGIPAALLSGRAAAGAIALINAIGVMGGLIGPVVVGALRDATGSLDAGMLVLAGVLALGAAMAATVPRTAPRP